MAKTTGQGSKWAAIAATALTMAQAPATAVDSAVPASDAAADSGSLPDLSTRGTSASQTRIQPGPGSLTVDSRDADSRFAAITETSQQTGAAVGFRGALVLTDGAALGGGLLAGGNKTEFFGNFGLNLFGAQRLVLTGAQLKQKLDFDFPSGRAKAEMTQNAVGASWRWRLGGAFVDHAQVEAYSARTASRDLGAIEYTIDTATLFERWNDPRRVAGGKTDGIQGKLGLKPWEGGGVTLGVGQERLRYDLLNGSETHTRPTGSLGLEQALDSQTRFKAGVDAAAAQGRISLGLDHRFGDAGTLGIYVSSIKGRDGAPNDNRLQLSWTFSLGRMAGGTGAAPLSDLGAARPGPSAMPAAGGNGPAPRTAFSDENLLDQVAMRPTWLPSQVVAKRDTTAPMRLIAVDKTALPAGASIAANGAISAPLGIVAAGIAGVTKNGAAFANSGQFALSGNNVVVNPNLISQPAVGVVDVYAVTVNIAGGGTALVIVNVSHGSVKIDSITVAGAPTASAVSITGTVQVGQVLTGHYAYAAADGTPQGASTFRWLRNGVAIAGATGSTYLLVNADYGAAITFEVTPMTVAPTTGPTVVSGATAAVTLPAGYVSQGGLIWTPNNILWIWADADSYCSGTTLLGQSGWRLPTSDELSALYGSGAIAGPGWVLSRTWSSTPYDPGFHAFVGLLNGSVNRFSDALLSYVTCVR